MKDPRKRLPRFKFKRNSKFFQVEMTVGMKPFSCPRCDKIFEDYKMLHEGTNTGDFQVSSLKRQSKLFQV